MEAILAKRYAFCNFAKIDGFPNPLPDRSEWEVSLPRFSGHDWEVPTEFLWDFHDWIHRLHFIHEDVKIKLFRYSLEGATLDWCRDLPKASITCLKEFHDAFNSFYKDRYPVECISPECCYQFDKQVESNDEQDIYNEAMVISEEGFQQPYCSHDFLQSPIFQEEDKQQIFEQQIIEQREEILGEQFTNQPLFDEYPNDEEEVFMSPCLKVYSDDPIYDSYESESGEDYKQDDAQPIQIVEELSPLPRIDYKQNSDEPTFEMYKFEVQGYSAEEEVCEKNRRTSS